MTTDTFTAGVQYGDWEGSAAADDADGEYDLAAFLEAKKLYDRDREFLIAASIYVAENQARVIQTPSIAAFVVECANNYDAIAEWLQEIPDPIPVRRIDVELSIEEFIGCFKRLNVVLLKRGLDLEGRGYHYAD